ncbi:hypothetical protein ACET3X_005118 [Alternaria dauci]|uniref:Uncharacterized protein n=1 Tax=Alternaria dauci TaxID=48095 RepID=A0ABR3UJC4_9PLEO
MRRHEPGPLHPSLLLRTINRQQGMPQVVLCAPHRANYRRSKVTQRVVVAYFPNPVSIDTTLGRVYYQKCLIKMLALTILETTYMRRKINPKLHHQHRKFRLLVQYQDVFDPDQCIRPVLHHLSALRLQEKRVLLVLCNLPLQSASLQRHKQD